MTRIPVSHKAEFPSFRRWGPQSNERGVTLTSRTALNRRYRASCTLYFIAAFEYRCSNFATPRRLAPERRLQVSCPTFTCPVVLQFQVEMNGTCILLFVVTVILPVPPREQLQRILHLTARTGQAYCLQAAPSHRFEIRERRAYLHASVSSDRSDDRRRSILYYDDVSFCRCSPPLLI